MDWNDLRYFLAVQRSGSLAGAARALGVEHSTVGRRLAALEQALGSKLFTRGPDGLLLTRAGAEIVPAVEAIATAVESITLKVGGEDERVSGTVRLTTSEGLTGLVVKSLADLRARHPGLLVEVLSGNQSLDLARGEADLAIRIAATPQASLLTRKVAEIGWSLYAAESYLERRGAPASPEALAGHDVIAFDESLSGIPGAQWIAAHGAGAHVVVRGNSIVSALNAAVVGMGLAVLPCFMAQPEPTLRRLTPAVLARRPVSLVVHPDLARTARVRAVMDFVVEMLAARGPELAGDGQAG